MQTAVFKIDPRNISFHDEEIRRAAEIIRAGGLVAFPTETVYGLGCSAFDENGAKKIYEAKGRPQDNPLIVHIADPRDAEIYAETNEYFYKIADAFMPGPITVILPKKDAVPLWVTAGLDTVGLRCPENVIARGLISAAGVGIAAPSANISGTPSPTSGAHVAKDMGGKIDAIIDGGECEIGLESTIISLDGQTATILRPGAVTYDALMCVCGEVRIDPSVTGGMGENERPLSPGMKYRHYAPRAPLFLASGADADVTEYFREKIASENCLVLCHTEDLVTLGPERTLSIGAREKYGEQAHNLFAALRIADTLEIDKIYARLPKSDGLGLALYNRLMRAASHTVINIEKLRTVK